MASIDVFLPTVYYIMQILTVYSKTGSGKALGYALEPLIYTLQNTVKTTASMVLKIN